MSTHGRSIIGTAGHIDHGKTELVHALTGQETDRLAEEKRRGISIELGFAHHEIEGRRFGVVDVPGHERFLRHMLAGAQGIDLVLLVVAADDGVMPQTEEHFDVVHLTGARRLLFVITKTDLADDARIEDVREEIAILAAGTGFEDAPVFSVSARTGAGVEDLRAAIATELAAIEPKPADGPFRMPIDRSFVLHGHGVVVTGTATSGSVAPGDTLYLRPGDQELRARTVQVHGEGVENAAAGQRIALNFPGIRTEDAPRGSWVTSAGVDTTTDRFDCELEVRPGAARPLRSFDRIRLHLGTAETQGKVILLEAHDELGPKQTALAQIVLDEPVLAGRGDRFVIRTRTAHRIAGGGRVLHAFAPRHKSNEKHLAEHLARLRDAKPIDAVASFLDLLPSFAASCSLIAQGLVVEEDELREEIPGRKDLVALPDAHAVEALTTRGKWNALRDLVIDALADYHRAHPMNPGMEIESLRSRLRMSVPPRLFRAAVDIFAEEGTLVRDESEVRLPRHEVRVEESDAEVLERITSALVEGEFAPPDAKQLAGSLEIPAGRIRALLKVGVDRGEIQRVSGDIYYDSTALERATGLLRDHLANHEEITVAEFRTAIGASRKYALALMDYFDQAALTVRVGDARRLRS